MTIELGANMSNKSAAKNLMTTGLSGMGEVGRAAAGTNQEFADYEGITTTIGGDNFYTNDATIKGKMEYGSLGKEIVGEDKKIDIFTDGKNSYGLRVEDKNGLDTEVKFGDVGRLIDLTDWARVGRTHPEFVQAVNALAMRDPAVLAASKVGNDIDTMAALLSAQKRIALSETALRYKTNTGLLNIITKS
jgi:hypothetical protein